MLAILNQRPGPVTDCVLIIGAWSVFVAALLVLQVLGLGVGFSVWPLGEDRAWVDILQRGGYFSTGSLFWQINDRNPLSPWWYVGLRALILNVDAGLLIIRYVVGLLLALTTYFFVVKLAGRHARMFALGVALVVALWMPNGFIDQVYWVFQVALIMSMISVLAYAHFLSAGRSDHRWYALSLICWLLAIASYSIQCGAIGAIGYLGLTRGSAATKKSWPAIYARTSVALTDFAPYFVVFIVFLLIWRTTVLNPSTYSLQPDIGRLLTSLRKGLWHEELLWWFGWSWQSPYWSVYAAVAIAAAPAAFVVLMWVWRGAPEDNLPINSRALVDTLIVIAFLVAPTVAVETAGSYWMPGWRWRMIYQLTTPMLYLSIVALLVRMIPCAQVVKKVTWCSAISLGLGLAVFLSLGHNRVQVDTTRNERLVRDALIWAAAEDFAAGQKPPFQYLVKTEPGFWWPSSDLLSEVYARTWFQRNDVSFRILPRTPGAPEHQAFWPVKFLPDKVANARILGISVDYNHLGVLTVNRHGVQRLWQLKADDFKGLQVEWKREQPVMLRHLPVPDCSFVWLPGQDAVLFGWGPPERDHLGFVRRPVSRRATINASVNCPAGAVIRLRISPSVSPHVLDRLRVRVNGREVATHWRMDGEDKMIEAQVPAELMTAMSPAELSLISWPSDILVRKIEVSDKTNEPNHRHEVDQP